MSRSVERKVTAHQNLVSIANTWAMMSFTARRHSDLQASGTCMLGVFLGMYLVTRLTAVNLRLPIPFHRFRIAKQAPCPRRSEWIPLKSDYGPS